MRYYLANKMSGVPLANFPWFERAAAYARSLDHEVISPHELDIADGVSVESAGDCLPYSALWRERLRKDLSVIPTCDAVAFGPDWRDSAGARLERDCGYDNAVEFWTIDPDKGILEPERVVALSGYARAGKDSAAAYLEQYGWQRRGFAAALKDMLYALNPIVTTSNAKRVQYYVDSCGWDEAKKLPEIRQLLQRLGTEGGRQILGQDTWVRHLLLSGVSEKLIIPDCRFVDEARAVEERGGIVIRIERPGLEAVNDHISEHALDDYDFYATVINDGTIESLGKQLHEIVNDHYSWPA